MAQDPQSSRWVTQKTTSLASVTPSDTSSPSTLKEHTSATKIERTPRAGSTRVQGGKGEKDPHQQNSPNQLLQILLEQNRQEPIIDLFSDLHDQGQAASIENRFRHLLPLGKPGEEEQYAFEVNLDVCSGCKACVAGCHNKNGLAENEVWRKVGSLTHAQTGVQQIITTACHHCREPGCLKGCPTGAYTKDASTGIVKHLDDQCIGCTYCTWTCPYEVPTYQPQLGIVRKCDMCLERLEVGEAPACVQSCPNEAIKITRVPKNVPEVSSEWNLPYTPDPHLTQPTTRYISKKEAGPLISAPSLQPQPAKSEGVLTAMLLLTQVSVGLLAVHLFTLVFSAEQLLNLANAGKGVFLYPLIAGVLAALGLALAPLHLGQPLKAWKVIVGLRTSWLSREAVVLGMYMGILSLYCLAELILGFKSIFQFLPPTLYSSLDRFVRAFGWMSLFTGIFGVYTSAMLYKNTAKWVWRKSWVTSRFFLGSLAGGLSVYFMLELILKSPGVPSGFFLSPTAVFQSWGGPVFLMLLLLKGGVEYFGYRQKAWSTHPEFQYCLSLLKGPLQVKYRLRWWVGFGAFFCIGFSAILLFASANYPLIPSFGKLLLGLGIILFWVGEFLERSLFFTSAVLQGMPVYGNKHQS